MFNKSIDRLEESSKEWENVYETLKMDKSDSELVNKLFIIDLPKVG